MPNKILKTKLIMKWYKSLSVHQRISLKDCSELIVGVRFEQLRRLFSTREIIEMLTNKLEIEGII